MSISDAVVGNLTTIYLLLIATMKAYALATGGTFTAACVIFLSTAVVAAILIVTLAWDVSRKALMKPAELGHPEPCSGGICWHGVAEKSPASQLQFRLPRRH